MSIQQQLQKVALNEQNKQREETKTLVEKLEADDNVIDCPEWNELKVLLGLKDPPPLPKEEKKPEEEEMEEIEEKKKPEPKKKKSVADKIKARIKKH